MILTATGHVITVEMQVPHGESEITLFNGFVQVLDLLFSCPDLTLNV